MAGLPSPILNSCCLFVERWSILRPIHPIIPVPDTFWLGIVPFLSQQDHLRSTHFLGSSTPYRSKRIMVAPGVAKPGIVRMRTAQRDTGVPVWPRTVQYRCCRLAVHRSELYGVWQRVANRSQIRLELYGHVLHGTARHSRILVSPPNCVPCSTEWPRRVPTCSESGCAQRIEAQSDWNCTDAYCTVLLVTVRYWCPCLTAYHVAPNGHIHYRPVWNLAVRSESKPNQTGIVQTRTARYRLVQCNTGTATRPHTVPGRTNRVGRVLLVWHLTTLNYSLRFPRQAALHTGIY